MVWVREHGKILVKAVETTDRRRGNYLRGIPTGSTSLAAGFIQHRARSPVS